MAGAAEHFEQIIRDMEDIDVMANDGSSADLLTSALNSISVAS